MINLNINPEAVHSLSEADGSQQVTFNGHIFRVDSFSSGGYADIPRCRVIYFTRMDSPVHVHPERYSYLDEHEDSGHWHLRNRVKGECHYAAMPPGTWEMRLRAGDYTIDGPRPSLNAPLSQHTVPTVAK